MSWRTGSQLFIEVWPAIKRNIKEREQRIEFTASLIQLFADWDMDPYDIEDLDPDIRAAIRGAGFEISEPERYEKEDLGMQG